MAKPKHRKKDIDQPGASPPEVPGVLRPTSKRTGAYFVAGLLIVLLTVATVLIAAKSSVVRGGRQGPARPNLPLPAGAGPDTIADPPGRLPVPRDTPQTAPQLPVPMDEGN